MTVTEQLAKNETVQEILYMMQAVRNGWIFEERKKPQPNEADIATWQAELPLLMMKNIACLTRRNGLTFSIVY